MAQAFCVVIVLLNPQDVASVVLTGCGHNLLANSLRNVSILAVAMRSQPAKISLLGAYWSHNIPVCEYFCIYTNTQ